MTYIYTKTNLDAFNDRFIDWGRKENFSYAGRRALYDYLYDLAQDTGEPVELDVIALCCEFSEYASLAEFNEAQGTTFESWEDVQDHTTVIEHSNGAAIVQNY
jgi:hypothetical protein